MLDRYIDYDVGCSLADVISPLTVVDETMYGHEMRWR